MLKILFEYTFWPFENVNKIGPVPFTSLGLHKDNNRYTVQKDITNHLLFGFKDPKRVFPFKTYHKLCYDYNT